MSLESKVQSLITAANAVTGESRTDLTAAVQDLKDGYGKSDISFSLKNTLYFIANCKPTFTIGGN